MQEPPKNVSYTIRLGRQKKCLGFLTDQRSRRAGTGPIIRHAEPAGIAILESNVADILADYREWRDQQAARVSTHSAGCHMWHERCMIDRLADALERARLTDDERHAIAVVRNCAMTRAERFLTQSDAEREATLVLWRLRERLG